MTRSISENKPPVVESTFDLTGLTTKEVTAIISAMNYIKPEQYEPVLGKAAGGLYIHLTNFCAKHGIPMIEYKNPANPFPVRQGNVTITMNEEYAQVLGVLVGSTSCDDMRLSAVYQQLQLALGFRFRCGKVTCNGKTVTPLSIEVK